MLLFLSFLCFFLWLLVLSKHRYYSYAIDPTITKFGDAFQYPKLVAAPGGWAWAVGSRSEEE